MRRPVLIGHRGLGRGVVDGHEQNTLGSFLAALECGLDWVEVDVRRTCDDVLVVAHDPAYPDGAFLVDLPAQEVARRGTLLLSDLLAALPEGAGVNVDLKTSMEDACRTGGRTTAELLAPVARRELRRRPLWVTSFDPGALGVLRERVPALPLGLLTWHGFPAEQAVAAAAALDVQGLALHVGSFGPTLGDASPAESGDGPAERTAAARGLRPLEHVLSLLHRSGRRLAAWCPQLAQARVLSRAGVDALIVDDVPRTVPALAADG